MKYLFLLLVLMGCATPKVEKKEASNQKITAVNSNQTTQDGVSLIDRDVLMKKKEAIEFKKEFDVFAKYYETNILYPYVTMNTKIVALTNKYGLVFINDRELAVSMEEMPKIAAPILAKGIRFYSTLFYTDYKEIYDGYYPTLMIHKTIRDVFYNSKRNYITGEIPFFDIAANDYEQMGLHEIFNNKFTLWELLQKEDPQLFSTIELFTASYDKTTGGSSMGEREIKNRRYYFLSVLYPVEEPDRFYNAILNFMIYKCWVYGGLNEFVPYDENMPNLSWQ